MRKNTGNYLLTSFGKVVYEAENLIGNAVENGWKLKAIDSIETSSADSDLIDEERRKIIDSLIESKNIKNILLDFKTNSDEKEKVDRNQDSIISEPPAYGVNTATFNRISTTSNRGRCSQS